MIQGRYNAGPQDLSIGAQLFAATKESVMFAWFRTLMQIELWLQELYSTQSSDQMKHANISKRGTTENMLMLAYRSAASLKMGLNG